MHAMKMSTKMIARDIKQPVINKGRPGLALGTKL